MPLKPINPKLRRLRNDSRTTTKVSLSIPAGDELEVSDNVGAQLQAASNAFKGAEPAAVPAPAEPVKRTARKSSK